MGKATLIETLFAFLKLKFSSKPKKKENDWNGIVLKNNVSSFFFRVLIN